MRARLSWVMWRRLTAPIARVLPNKHNVMAQPAHLSAHELDEPVGRCRWHNVPFDIDLSGTVCCRKCRREAAHELVIVSRRHARTLRDEIEPVELARAE